MADQGMIDMHQHIVPDLYKDRLASVGIGRGGGTRGFPDWSEQLMLDVMGRNGIAAAVTTITSPGHYFGDIEFTKALCRDCNDWSADLVARHRKQIANLAVVPLPDVDAALRETEYVLDTLKAPGVGLFSHYGDCYLGEPEHEEFYAELDRRGAIAFVHPDRFAPKEMPRYSYSNGTTELVFDTTRAMVNLLHNGVFARYPNIRWIFSHCGGVTPFIAYRLKSYEYDPKMKDKVPGGVEAVLKRLYYDTAQAAGAAQLFATMEVAAIDHMFFGTDYPFARTGDESVITQAEQAIRDYTGWDEAAKNKVFRENALRLFPQFG